MMCYYCMTRCGDKVGSVTYERCRPEDESMALLLVKFEVSRLNELDSYFWCAFMAIYGSPV